MTNEKLPDLRQFTGSEHWYRHSLNRAVVYTDGAKYVADQVGAYWLLDEIALSLRQRPEICVGYAGWIIADRSHGIVQVMRAAARPDANGRCGIITAEAASGRDAVVVGDHGSSGAAGPTDGIVPIDIDSCGRCESMHQ